jgi:hypothetical protein
MPVPLPNLDDRRWADLVDEGRALIPVYAPEWTDHNVHDPGVTLIELLAWIAEMNVYQLDQVPPRHRLKFLSLIGIRPEPPRPSRTVLRFVLAPGAAPVTLPATTEFEASDPFGQPTRVRTLADLEVVPSELRALQVEHQGAFRDLTARWQRHERLRLLGDDPRAGSALYLGLAGTPPTGARVSLRFTFGDLADGEAKRQRLIGELIAQQAACGPRSRGSCGDRAAIAVPAEPPSPPVHHSVRLVWEFLTGGGRWRRLDPATGEVEDDTRAFTLDGRVAVTLPEPVEAARLGRVDALLCYLRCRLAEGSYDEPPAAVDVALNAVAALQAVPAGALEWAIAGDATVEGPEPAPGALASFDLEVGDGGAITRLRFTADEETAFRVLVYRPASPAEAGLLRIEAELLGHGTARPYQHVTLSRPPAVEGSVRILTLEGESWRRWTPRADFDASSRSDRHYVLDAELGRASFGDGEHGSVAPLGAPIVASYLATRADAGNLDADTVYRLSTSPHNQAILADPADVTARLALVAGAVPAAAGAGAETLAHAEGRAVTVMERPNRAVTLADYEYFARETPGVRLARVSARANAHPALPCLVAPGMISLLVLPSLPADRPMPSAGLRRMVAAHLGRRRIVGTRVEVFGPTYVEIAVRATVQAYPKTSATALRDRIIAGLDRFFHPLVGGPDGQGWPFGRDVYRSEVLQVIDETDGVDHVLSLELLVGDGDARCGNVCLGPTGLVAAGRHQIEVG